MHRFRPGNSSLPSSRKSIALCSIKISRGDQRPLHVADWQQPGEKYIEKTLLCARDCRPMENLSASGDSVVTLLIQQVSV